MWVKRKSMQHRSNTMPWRAKDGQIADTPTSTQSDKTELTVHTSLLLASPFVTVLLFFFFLFLLLLSHKCIRGQWLQAILYWIIFGSLLLSQKTHPNSKIYTYHETFALGTMPNNLNCTYVVLWFTWIWFLPQCIYCICLCHRGFTALCWQI